MYKRIQWERNLFAQKWHFLTRREQGGVSTKMADMSGSR